MKNIKVSRNSEQRKRLSETKPAQTSVYEYRLDLNETTKYTHNRSTSTGKNKKLRLSTDYEALDIKKSLDKNARRTNYSKRRKDTEYFTYKRPGQDLAVQSTKSNQKRNVELRNLFNGTRNVEEASHSRSKSKGYTAHHPLLKYVTNKKNKDSVQNPYTSQIDRFQHLYSKIKKQTSKAKRPPNSSHQNQSATSNNNNRQLSISLKKNQIRIGPKDPVPRREKQDTQQETVKTIKKRSEIEKKEQYTSKSRNSDLSSFQNQEGYGLTQEEEQTFGDRFPYGFQKIKLLGRGGFSLVWLGRHIKNGRQLAIKQIITQNTHQTHIKQIWFGTNFFTLGGNPKPEFAKFPGIKNLARMFSYEINQSDTWIFYQKCGQSLGSNLYDIKAERVYGDQRLYKIFYKPFYESMSRDIKLLKSLIIQMCKPLVVLSECEIVHSDLKTQNILIKYESDENKDSFKLTEAKLIDYGSSFEFRNISQFSMATPEYMPPEILNYIIHQNQGQYEEELYEKVMTEYRNPWIVDIFSLGCVLLEIVVGVPLWMSLPLLVPSKTGTSYCQKEGLFAVKGRLFPEIIQKQRKVIGRIDEVLDKQNYSKICLTPATRRVIKGMLEIDFHKRISPSEVITILEQEKH